MSPSHHTHTRVRASTHAHTHTCVRACTHKDMHTRTHKDMHTRTHKDMHARTRAHTHKDTHTHTHTHTHTLLVTAAVPQLHLRPHIVPGGWVLPVTLKLQDPHSFGGSVLTTSALCSVGQVVAEVCLPTLHMCTQQQQPVTQSRPATTLGHHRQTATIMCLYQMYSTPQLTALADLRRAYH